MYQIYFLSIFCNFFAGLALSFNSLEEKLSLTSAFNKDFFQSNSFRIIFGSLTFVVGVLKLLSVTKGDIPVAGDLIPALVGLLLGITLLVQYYQERANKVQTETTETMENVFLKNKSAIGIIGVVVAIIHFFIPSVLFL